MRAKQQLAYDHLTEPERMALSLVIVSERTKKEASVIMNLAPYKFTEIYLRARKFFVMFTEFYEDHTYIVPPSLRTDTIFLLYLSLLLKRKTNKVLLTGPTFLALVDSKARKAHWDELMRSLNNSRRTDSIQLLQEFDRWNNYRILPKQYQLQPAFPRRKNRALKKISNNLYAISDHGWDLLIQRYGTNDLPPMNFIPIIQTGDFRAYAIRGTQPVTDYMTRNRIPVFIEEKVAKEFAELLWDYQRLKKRSTYSARKFWANFRILIKKAYNYIELVNLRGAPEEIISQNDQAFLKSIKLRRPRVRGRSSDKQFYP